MARVRSRNTAPEVVLRKELWALGRRYQLHAPIPGRPDIVFAGPRVAVFVDGCFWHGCPEHYSAPAANAEFWRAKLERNVARDRRADHDLAGDGWLVLRVWEHEIATALPAAVDRVTRAIDSRAGLAAGRV
jgi:DNA mismatch endonuclease (patch repair protein)